jgi:trehalose synthase
LSIEPVGESLLQEFEPTKSLSLDDYSPYLKKEKSDIIRKLAEPLEGYGWANINSTMLGGGVAEMLYSIIPLARGLGINAYWYAIQGTDNFFAVTKKFHNMLQGEGDAITMDEIFGAYLDNIDENTKNTLVASDLVVIHDPQPAALVMNGVLFGNILWRCHIDTSSPNMTVWRFLLPYINHCSGAIFTMPEFIGPGLQIPLYEINPCIDPLAQKNKEYSRKEALEILSPLFNKNNIDPDRPILAAISRYDIHKNQATIIDAFQKLDKKNYKKPPYLLFVGNTATDDPEGAAMLEKLKKQADGSSDILFWVNVDDNDRVIGSLMSLARAFIHVSTREGFGLVVTEALWQGTPVIGSSIGGIKKQIIDQTNGYLVDPKDADAIARHMNHLLENPEDAEKMGVRGKEHVRNYFLLPELIYRYMILLRFYLGIDQDFPAFRLDQLSYSEIIASIRSKRGFLPFKKNNNK